MLSSIKIYGTKYEQRACIYLFPTKHIKQPEQPEGLQGYKKYVRNIGRLLLITSISLPCTSQ